MKKSSDIIIWVALVLALVALVLAWISYNRTGVNLENKLQAQMRESYIELQRELALAEIRTELALIQVRYQATDDYQAALEQAQEARKNINEFYKDVRGENKDDLERLNQEFDKLEQYLRQESARALEQLEIIIELIRQDLKTPEN